MRRRIVLMTLTAVVFASLSLFLLSCGNKGETPGGAGRLKAVTTLFPLWDFTRAVGGDKVEATLLVPPGVEPHSFEPKPGDVARIASAQVFIYTGKYMEPWAEGLLKGVAGPGLLAVDASKGITVYNTAAEKEEGEHGGHSHGAIDPHIWLDFSKAAVMVDTIVQALATKDPANREFYEKNGSLYKGRLDDLDRRFKDALSRCKTRTFVHGGHFAFNYLARRYELDYVSAYKGSPDAEPTPRRVAHIKNIMKIKGIHYIFYEELITPRVAQVIADETGASLLRLHGGHNVTRDELNKGVTFLSLMEENLEHLKKGLVCQ